MLTRGPRWTPEETSEVTRLQKAHLANIRKLAESGQLVLAGPFTDGDQLRGAFAFKVDTLEEAKAPAAGDSAVKAGRLAMEIHPWMVKRGVLP